MESTGSQIEFVAKNTSWETYAPNLLSLRLPERNSKEFAMYTQLLFAAITSLLIISPGIAEDRPRMLFSFDDPGQAGQWQTVNDGVMGGRSDGRMRMNSEGYLYFFGTLSLENNGGFASVRSRGASLNLKSEDSIAFRVRGDGREYSVNLYPAQRRTAYSYRAKFKTKKNEWTEIRIPLRDFVATSFGRTLPNQRLDPSRINGIGFLLGDKRPGPFALAIDWIKVEPTSTTPANGTSVAR